MQSKAKSVDSYIEQAPSERHEALRRLRVLCRQVLTGFEEIIMYGMPSYARKGVVEVAFASQKNYISLYILRQDALAAQRAALAGSSVGKGCIRYARPDKIDYAVVREMLVATRDQGRDLLRASNDKHETLPGNSWICGGRDCARCPSVHDRFEPKGKPAWPGNSRGPCSHCARPFTAARCDARRSSGQFRRWWARC